MDELKRAIYALLHQAELSEEEVVHLSLQDLHLSGQEPSITVLDDVSGERRTVKLTDSVRNALVGWMLVRPDRPVRLVFPGQGDADLTAEEIAGLLEDFDPAEAVSEPAPPPVVSAETMHEEGLPEAPPPPESLPPRRSGPAPFRTVPPPSTPEHIGRAEPTTSPEKAPERVKTAASSATPQATDQRRLPVFPIVLGLLGLLVCGGLIVGAVKVLPGQFARLFGAEQTPVAQVDDSELTPAAEDPAGGETEATTPTATPAPTDAPTSEPTDTPAPTDTATPEPTATPAPTDTPTSEPTNTPAPIDTPTPEPTATPSPIPTNSPVPATPRPPVNPGFKYSAPQLVLPEQNFVFIAGNTIDLRWESVGELAANEHYAVRLVYFHESEVTYGGSQVQEPQWTVPLELYHEADGPKHEYSWFVYVEQTQADGTGVPISPESQARTFTWD